MIRELPAKHEMAYRRTQALRESGITSQLNEANSIVIDELRAMLVALSQYLQSDKFGKRTPAEFIDSQIKELLDRRWQESGERGTIRSVVTGAQAIEDIEKLVEQFVAEIISSAHLPIDLTAWFEAWRASA